jgi:hypothetical protein
MKIINVSKTTTKTKDENEDERRKRRRKTKTKTKDENGVDRKRTERKKKVNFQNKCVSSQNHRMKKEEGATVDVFVGHFVTYLLSAG